MPKHTIPQSEMHYVFNQVIINMLYPHTATNINSEQVANVPEGTFF